MSCEEHPETDPTCGACFFNMEVKLGHQIFKLQQELEIKQKSLDFLSNENSQLHQGLAFSQENHQLVLETWVDTNNKFGEARAASAVLLALGVKGGLRNNQPDLFNDCSSRIKALEAENAKLRGVLSLAPVNAEPLVRVVQQSIRDGYNGIDEIVSCILSDRRALAGIEE